MRPQSNAVPGCARQQARDQRRPVPLTPVGGVDDKLAAHVAALRFVVGLVQVRVAEHGPAVGGQHDVARQRPAAVPDLQEHVLAERGDAVGARRGRGQREHLGGPLGSERALFDVRAGG